MAIVLIVAVFILFSILLYYFFANKVKRQNQIKDANIFFAPIIASKTFTPISVPVNLPDGEKCYYSEDNVALGEKRTARVKSNTFLTIKKIDIGSIYLTEKRLMYVSGLQNKSINYKDILESKPYLDSMSIAFNSSTKNWFLYVKNPMIVKGMLTIAPYAGKISELKDLSIKFE